VRGAEIDLAALPPLLGDVTFHCQQAVEKTLRGYLTWHDHGFRKTHDLTELGGACVELDPSLEMVLRRAATLTEYAWRYRYPGEPNAPEEQRHERRWLWPVSSLARSWAGSPPRHGDDHRQPPGGDRHPEDLIVATG
jgi:HEPN domain